MLSAQVGALILQECANCTANPDISPAAPVLTALPGLLGLLKIRSGTSGSAAQGSLIVKGTAFSDVSSLSNLRCPAGFFQLTNNIRLTSFRGFEALQAPTFSTGATFIATGNPLTDSASVAPIRTLAGCPTGTSSPQSAAFYVSTIECVLPVRAPHFCENFGNCFLSLSGVRLLLHLQPLGMVLGVIFPSFPSFRVPALFYSAQMHAFRWHVALTFIHRCLPNALPPHIRFLKLFQSIRYSGFSAALLLAPHLACPMLRLHDLRRYSPLRRNPPLLFLTAVCALSVRFNVDCQCVEISIALPHCRPHQFFMFEIRHVLPWGR